MGLESNNLENTAGEIWGMVKEQLSQKIPPAAMFTWFNDDKCEPIDLDKHTLFLRVNLSFSKKVIEYRFSSIIVSILNDILSCDDAELIILAKDGDFIY